MNTIEVLIGLLICGCVCVVTLFLQHRLRWPKGDSPLLLIAILGLSIAFLAPVFQHYWLWVIAGGILALLFLVLWHCCVREVYVVYRNIKAREQQHRRHRGFVD
jgi:hypothetical protein